MYVSGGVNYKLTDKVILQAGYTVGHDQTEDDRYENVRHGPNAGAMVQVADDMIGRFNVSYNYADYEGADASFGNRVREDEIYNVNARMTYDLDQHLNTDGVSVNLDLGYVRSDSNIKIYDYDRQTATLSIKKAW